MSVNRLILRHIFVLSDIREETNRKNGMHLTDYYVGLVRKERKKELEDLSRKHEKKLSKLSPRLAAAISDQPTQTAESRFPGRLKITTNRYTTDSFPVMKNHQVRPHCRLNRKVKKKRIRMVTSANRRYDYVPTQKDVRKFDPIVLTDRVRLSQDQISMCCLPDCFALTPRTPTDVSDQLIGTHQWAERLRWHRFHEMKKREEGVDDNALLE